MPNIFKDGGGAGIGSYVVVFQDGQLAANTSLLRLRGAYESGEQIYFSIDDAETKDALVPASGWIDEELKLHLVARDFDDNKTYAVSLSQGVTESEITVEVEAKDGIEAGGEPLGGGVEIAGNSLVIPEQQLQPVATIDGVAYYHKQEFDLEALCNPDLGRYLKYNLLSGEQFVPTDNQRTYIEAPLSAGTAYYARLVLSNEIRIYVYTTNSAMIAVDYTSRAFTVVDTKEEVTDNTKICLPTCSAYYGFLSEDGKTFISYYNLKSDGAPAYVDSIKQGNAVMPLNDPRLPAPTAADATKVVKVGSNGRYELGEDVGGVTEERVQEMIDAAIGDALAASY